MPSRFNPNKYSVSWSFYPPDSVLRRLISPYDTVSLDSAINWIDVRAPKWKLLQDKNADTTIRFPGHSSSRYNACESFFWDTIAKGNKSYYFPPYVTTRNWHFKWKVLEKSIIEKAKILNLDYVGLQECFNVIRPADTSKLAYIPVGTYFVFQENEPVWIISCNLGPASTNEDYTLLAHKCIWAIRIKDKKHLCFFRSF